MSTTEPGRATYESWRAATETRYPGQPSWDQLTAEAKANWAQKETGAREACITVGTAPSEEVPGTFCVTVHVKRGDDTTVVYQQRHSAVNAMAGMQPLPHEPTSSAQTEIAWRAAVASLTQRLDKLQAHLATPDFERLAGMRQSELTEAEKADALEGWLRKNSGWFLNPHLTHIEFLLQRIDALRNPPKDLT